MNFSRLVKLEARSRSSDLGAQTRMSISFDVVGLMA